MGPNELLQLVVVDGLIELGHEPLVLQRLGGEALQVRQVHLADTFDALFPGLFTTQVFAEQGILTLVNVFR